MKTVYQAAHALEAHMLADLIRQQGLRARVDGEYLQGGVGELPAAGLVRVLVEEEDYAAARAIVEAWDAAQPRNAPAAPVSTPSRVPAFLLGVGVGFAIALLFFG